MLGLAVKRNYLGGLGLAPRDSDGIHLGCNLGIEAYFKLPK